MRWFALSMFVFCAVSTNTVSVSSAQHIDHRNKPVTPRIEVIPPLGTNLPPSYRWRYNRPSYVGGKIAYWIAPSSQEAMAWQNAMQAGAYRNHLPRLERHYFYPKPWEALQVGPRTPRDAPEPESEAAENQPTLAEPLVDQGPQRQPVIVRPLERETVGDDDASFGEEFGSIVLVNPAAFSIDAPSSDGSSPSHADPYTTGIGGEAESDSEDLRETLRRLQEENRRLRARL